MSGRGATGAVLTEWTANECRPVHLLEVDFNPYLYFTDAGNNVDWNSHTYLASQFLGFSSIKETSELLANSCTVSLSGVDQSIVAALLQETYLHRRLKIRIAMLNGNLLVVSSPVLIFDGYMTQPSIAVDPDNGQVNCSVEAVSLFQFDRTRGRHSNDTEQQRYFPGDRGFKQVISIPEKIFWGVQTDYASGDMPSRPPTTGSGRGRRGGRR